MAQFFNKEAKSADPIQQKLRDRKRTWNTSSKLFIKKLIGFKKGLNGTGSAEVKIPTSKIQEPLPNEVGSFLNELSANFEQLVNEAGSIIEEQLAYSQNRRKPIDKTIVQNPLKMATASKKPELKIGNYTVPTLLAITQEEQEQGLMGVEWPPPVMSFVYSAPTINRFWMKGTQSPLDIIFCKSNKINQICAGVPFSTQLIGDNIPSDLVVEVPYGTCEKLGINIGDPVELIK